MMKTFRLYKFAVEYTNSYGDTERTTVVFRTTTLKEAKAMVDRLGAVWSVNNLKWRYVLG